MKSENSIMRIFVESQYTFPESVLSVLSVLPLVELKAALPNKGNDFSRAASSDAKCNN
jgi:hypothetical protein